MKKTTKIITAIISMLLTLSIIFVAVSATDSGTPAATETTENALLYSDVREVISLRTETVKHFRLPDGTYQMVYYAEPIHRLDADGVWQNIDNTLSVKAVNGTQKLATPDERAAFAPTFAFNSNVLTLSENGYTISMAMLGGTSGVSKMSATATAAPVVANAPQSSNATSWSTLEEATSIDNSSSIVYQNVALNTDLEYVLQNNRIKENIIVKGAQDGYSYAFTLTLSGLTAELEESGRISISDAETAEPKYVIPAPYMYDADGNLSYDVTYTLTEVKTGMYILTVEADETWINASGRAFPVTIDPTLILNVGVYDTYVSSDTPYTHYAASTILKVNSTSTALIRYNVAGLIIPDGITVDSANVRIPCYHSGTTTAVSTTVSMQRVTEGWSDTTVNLPARTSIKDVTITPPGSASATNPATAIIPISKDIVLGWINTPQSNYGLAFKYQSGNQNLQFLSYESTVAKPTLSIGYTYDISTGIYGFSNDYYTTRWLNVSSDATAGTSLTHKVVSSSHTLSIADRDILFKITERGTGTYIIRSMIDNTLSLNATSAPVTMKTIAANNFDVSTSDMFAIEWDGYGFLLHPYNNTSKCITMTTASTATLSLISAPTTSSSAHWNVKEYTPAATDNGNYGVDVPQIMFTGERLTITPNKWTTTIGANEPYIYATSDVTNSFTQNWDSTTKTFTLDVHYPCDITIHFSYNPNYTVMSNEYVVAFSTLFDETKNYYFFNSFAEFGTESNYPPTYCYVYMQIDKNAAGQNATVFGSILDSKESHATWNFVHVVDNYYTIKSAKYPTLSLTIPSTKTNISGTSPVLSTHTGANNQLWKISQTNLSQYYVSPKSSETDSGCMNLAVNGTIDSTTNNCTIAQSNTTNTDYLSWNIFSLAPTIGGELPYDPDDWDTYSDYNNCYAYAIDNLVKSDVWYDDIQQPGEYSGNSIDNLDESTLTLKIYEDLIIEAVIADYAQLLSEKGFSLSANDCFIEVSFDYEIQNTSMYKVALLVDSDWNYNEHKEDFFYHWYRQNPDGFWSNKTGKNFVTNLDGSQNLIVNPNVANDAYSTSARFFILIPWSAIKEAAEIQSTQNLPTNAAETECTEYAILTYGKYEKEDAA